MDDISPYFEISLPRIPITSEELSEKVLELERADQPQNAEMLFRKGKECIRRNRLLEGVVYLSYVADVLKKTIVQYPQYEQDFMFVVLECYSFIMSASFLVNPVIHLEAFRERKRLVEKYGELKPTLINLGYST